MPNLKKLIAIEINDYNIVNQTLLQPYFDTRLTECSDSERERWYQNLQVLAEYNTGIAHCVQHNAIPRLLVESQFRDNLPECYQGFTKQIACQAGVKLVDNFILKGNVLTGSKHWITNLQQSDFAVVRATDGAEYEFYVLIDLTHMLHSVEPGFSPIGLNIARPSTLVVQDLVLPENYIWDRQSYITKGNSLFFQKNLVDYSFTTNYIGCIIGLYKEIENYSQAQQLNIDYELKRLKVAVASLKMMWEDVLPSLHTKDFPDNKFWHRRNTLYTQSKNTLVSLISLLLGIGDSRWLDASSPSTQKFRDALMFSSHMSSLYKNLEGKHFVNF